MARKFKTPITIDELGSASSQALAANVDGDSQNRINIDAGGKITWGSGSATGDTTLYRSAADTLKTDDAFTATSLAVTGQFTFPTSDGSADQVITTNGSGTLTWSDVSANATVSDTAPSSPATGQIWYESDTGRTFVYYDSFWVEVGASPPASPFITDLDEDTKIQVEESSDEDKIRFDTAGSERMIIDASGNVGIGTTTPGQALDVRGRIVANYTDNAFPLSVQSGQSTSGIILADAGTTSNVVLRSKGDDFQIRTNASDRVTVDSSGNVGIGTTTPAYKLDVAGDIHIIDSNPHLIFTDTSTNAESRISADSNQGSLRIEADYNNESADTNILFYSDGTERMRIDSSGNVGIGTTSPAYVLDVDGTARFSGTITADGNKISMPATVSRNKYRLWSSDLYVIGFDSGYTFGALGDYAMTFQMNDDSNRGWWWGHHNHTNAQGSMSLTTAGQLVVAGSIRVGYGETDTSAPASTLNVAGNGLISRAGGSAFTLTVENSSPVGSGVVRGIQVELGPNGNEDYTDSGDDYIRFLTSNNQEVGGIRGTGAASVSYGTTSDYRLKAPIEEISDGLSLVRNLAPMYGKWLNQNDPDRIYSYFIAHELQEHIPDAVDGTKDAVDEEGQPDYQSVDYGKLTPVLTAAIKDLDALVGALTARIEALEAN